MKIKMLCSAAGAGFAYRPGDKVDHKPDSDAHAWIACGVAEPDFGAAGAEQATAPPPPGVAVIRRRPRRATPPQQTLPGAA